MPAPYLAEGSVSKNRLLLAVALAAVFAAAAFAQNTSGTLAGTVLDTSRAGVGGARIQVRNLETGAVYRATSSPKGEYTVRELPAGKYEISVTADGFNPYRRQDVHIQAAQELRIDIPVGDFITLDTLGEDRATFAVLFKRPEPPAGPVPRFPDGRPDLSGAWFGPIPSNPDEAEVPEMLPWAEALTKERTENNSKDFPGSHCLPGGIGLMGPFLNRLVHRPEVLVSIIELDIPGYRQVFLDGRGHPDDLEPTWQGHSIGKWEGDTLVVETIGFNDKTWLDPAGNPHTEMLRLTTRLRRIDLGHLEVEVTFEDPGAYKKPWKTKGVAVLATNEEVQEYICTENNQDVPHLIGK
jgi:hypothetical protein